MHFKSVTLYKGKRLEHIFEAKNRQYALEWAKQHHKGELILIKVFEPTFLARAQKRLKALFSDDNKAISTYTLALTIEQLVLLLDSKLSISQAINHLGLHSQNRTIRRIFLDILLHINAGSSLYEAAKMHQKNLGSLTVMLIGVGEQSGNLLQALTTLHRMLTTIDTQKRAFAKSLAYPKNVFLALSAATVLLITYVLPQFETLFMRFDTALPLATRILMKLSHIQVWHIISAVTAISLAIAVIGYLKKEHKEVALFIDAFILKLPLFGTLIQNYTLGHYIYILNSLLNAGVTLEEATLRSTQFISNSSLKQRLFNAHIHIKKGATLHEAYAQVLTNGALSMLSTAQHSGALTAMLESIYKVYMQEFEHRMQALQRAIEPVFLIMITAMVLLLALGVFMPMWDMMHY